MGASFFTNPIDVVKTRLQIRGSGGSDGGSMFLYIMRNEGYIRPFFRGLSASMLRGNFLLLLIIIRDNLQLDNSNRCLRKHQRNSRGK